MLLFLLLFGYYVNSASSASFFTLIPNWLGLSVGNESYRISLNPAIGTPSPPPKSVKNMGNLIFISGAQPGARYEIGIYYTNSSLRDVQVWQGISFTAPMPPNNLTVIRMKGNKDAVISWSPPKQGVFSKYLFTLFNLSDPAITPLYDNVPLKFSSTSLTLHNLIPGGFYDVQVRTVSEYKEKVINSESFARGNFTLKPEQPDKFIVSFRNETTLIIMWHRPSRATIVTGYKAFIIPPSASESIIFLKKELNAADASKATFTSLVPGRPYNIYVQTVSGDEYSIEVVDQYRTLPLPPSSLTYDSNSLTVQSVLLKWKPPRSMCEFDAYQISTNEQSIAPIIKDRNDSMVHLMVSDAFLPGHSYQVTVRTLSANVVSSPVSVNVTFRPLPVTNLRSLQLSVVESTNDSVSEGNTRPIHYTISWEVDDVSSQDHFKIIYSGAEFQNRDSNTTSVVNNLHQVDVLFLPGRNYSIFVQAVSHGVESDKATIHQVTNPSTPFIDKITYNENNLSITWQSSVDSRQEHYLVNITTDDPLVKSETKMTTEEKLLISNLYPGATYDIKIVAVYLGLNSTPEEYKHVVYPKPPPNVTVVRNSNNSLLAKWQIPANTIFHAVEIAYQTGDDPMWHALTTLKADVKQVVIKKMITGEQYQIQVSTVTTNGVKCLYPSNITYVLPPSPVSNIVKVEEGLDSTCIFLKFERPPGRIDYYEIVYVDSNNETEVIKKISAQHYLFSNFPRISLPNLKPGVEYQLNLTCVSRGLQSIPISAIIRLKPRITSQIQFIHDKHAKSIILKYSPTQLTSTYFDQYKVQISDSESTVKYKSVNDTDREIVFHNLIPGKLYEVKVWTVAAGVLSAQPLEKLERLYPEPINDMYAKSLSDRSIELVWNKPSGEYDDFEVQYMSNLDNSSASIVTQDSYAIINTLQPYRQYTFSVRVRSGTRGELSTLRCSEPQSANFTTHESIPGKIENFQPINVQPSQIEFSWNLPSTSHNGVLLKYFLTCNLDDSSSDYKALDILPTYTQITIEKLEPGKKYVFAIRAETNVGFGPVTEWNQIMPIGAPPQPSSEMVPKEVAKSEHSIKIQFSKDFFSDDSGPITAYTIVVSEDISENISKRTTLPSWSVVHLAYKWTSYQAVNLFYPFANASEVNFTIGEENCLDQRIKSYCNGPLKSGSTYYVKIRAFTSPEKYTDTDYSLPVTTTGGNPFLGRGFGLLKKQIKENSIFIGIMSFCLIIFSVSVCKIMGQTTRKKRTLNRSEIRRIGKRVIQSSAVIVEPVPQQHHPFTKPLENRKPRIPPLALHEYRA